MEGRGGGGAEVLGVALDEVRERVGGKDVPQSPGQLGDARLKDLQPPDASAPRGHC
jgi:hypothetical protein